MTPEQKLVAHLISTNPVGRAGMTLYEIAPELRRIIEAAYEQGVEDGADDLREEHRGVVWDALLVGGLTGGETP